MRFFSDYQGLRLQGKELKELENFYFYIKEAKKALIEENLPQYGLDLLQIMQQDIFKFSIIISEQNDYIFLQ